jgi:hypothetical protein
MSSGAVVWMTRKQLIQPEEGRQLAKMGETGPEK